MSEADAQGYFEYLALLYKRFRIAKDNFLQRPFRKPTDFYNPKSLIAGFRLHTLGDAYSSVSRYVSDDRLRKALAFQTLYIGISPYEGPSLYMIIPLIELLYGVWFMPGGMYAMAEGMARLFEELGGELRTSAPVERIAVEDGRAVGVVAGGELVRADYVVCDADFPYAMENLLAGEARGRFTDEKLEGMEYSCSCFILYLGLDKRYPAEAVHSIRFAPDFERNIADIFDDGRFPDDPSFYCYAPCSLDASLAPEGCQTLYVLVPVPPLADGGPGWGAEEVARYRERVLDLVERETVYEDVRDHIAFERVFTPNDFAERFNASRRRHVRAAAHAAAEQLLAAAQQGRGVRGPVLLRQQHASGGRRAHRALERASGGRGASARRRRGRLGRAGGGRPGCRGGRARRRRRGHGGRRDGAGRRAGRCGPCGAERRARRCVMYAARDPFEEHADDFAWCEDVIRRNSHSFYRAFSLLPPRKRNGVFAVYAFCRAADDCVDVEASRERLESLQRDLERFDAGGMPRGPLWRALGVVFGAFDEDTAPFFDMLEGQRRDLAFRQPADLGELEDYGYYVAGSVGLMLLPLLRAGRPVDDALRADAVALGVAMQLTNILRDVGEDWNAGRVYLPAAVMEEAGLVRGDLAARRANAAFRTAWERVARRSEELYLPLQRDILRLDGDSRLPTLSSLFLYRGILDQVRADGYSCLERRSTVTGERAAALVDEARALLARDEKAALAAEGR